MFRVFWFGKIVTVKGLSISLVVYVPQTKMPLIAVVPTDSHLKPWIPMLENFAPYLTRPAVLATGIVCWVLVILLLPLQSKVIFSPKLSSVSPSALFILARDQAFFKTLFFSADRGSDLRLIWVWKPRKLCTSLKTIAFYSIIFGVQLCETAPLTSLEFVAIQIPSSRIISSISPWLTSSSA